MLVQCWHRYRWMMRGVHALSKLLALDFHDTLLHAFTALGVVVIVDHFDWLA